MRVRMSMAPKRTQEHGLFFEERAVFELGEGLLELLLGVHDDGAVPGYGFAEGAAGDEEEADAVFAGFDGYFVAGVEQN